MPLQKRFTIFLCCILPFFNTLVARENPSPAILQIGEEGSESGSLDFSKGTRSVPTWPCLTATQGQINVMCRMPANWPVAGDEMLFHAQSDSHIHVTLFFRDGVLTAVYKGGRDFFASTKLGESAKWEAGSRHRIQFGWKPAVDDAGNIISNDVEFVLITDGVLAGKGYGRVMNPWPETGELGGRNGKNLWQGKIDKAVFSPDPFLLSDILPDLKEGERTITVESDREIGPCYRFWTVANCNGPHRCLKPGYAESKKIGQPFITQINAVYLLGGRYHDQNVWYKGISPEGDLLVDFSGMIAQLKAMLDGGYTPWISLDNTPYAMNKNPADNTYGNTEPPDDERIWARYVKAAIQAMIDAFGKEQVSGWWFRVHCEPDLNPGHWTGTREQYFTHYDYTVTAVKELLPDARIAPGNILNPRDGQFGTQTKGMWGLDIIDHAGAGVNAVSGGIGSAMDWFSCSCYARVGRPLSDFDDTVMLMRNRLNHYPQFRNIPLVIGEFAILHDENGRRLWCGDTTEWGASFYAGMADRVYRYNILQVYEWSQTTSGIYHPRTQVIAMLDRMADGNRVKTEVKAESKADCGAIACRKENDLYILLYNHRAMRRPSVPEKVHLEIRDKRMKRKQMWSLSESIIDATHASWAYEFADDCRKAGVEKISTAGRYEGGVYQLYGNAGIAVLNKNLEKYRKLSQVEETKSEVVVSRKSFECDITMDGHSVRLLKLSPPDNVSEENGKSAWGIFDFIF